MLDHPLAAAEHREGRARPEEGEDHPVPLGLPGGGAGQVVPTPREAMPGGQPLERVEVDVHVGDEGPQALHRVAPLGPARARLDELIPRPIGIVLDEPVDVLRAREQRDLAPGVIALAGLDHADVEALPELRDPTEEEERDQAEGRGQRDLVAHADTLVAIDLLGPLEEADAVLPAADVEGRAAAEHRQDRPRERVLDLLHERLGGGRDPLGPGRVLDPAEGDVADLRRESAGGLVGVPRLEREVEVAGVEERRDRRIDRRHAAGDRAEDAELHPVRGGDLPRALLAKADAPQA